MPSPILLYEGELVCNGAFRFLRYANKNEKEKAPKSYKKFRCGIFECQQCSQHTIFLAPICRLLNGDIKHCPNCANEARHNKKLKYVYQYGDYIGSSKNLVFIREAGRDNSKCRLVEVQDLSDGIIFTARLSHILSGRTTSSPQSVARERNERFAECKKSLNLPRKYEVGDILGPENNILFVKELQPIREPSGHLRRMGIFKNLQTGIEVKTLLKSIISGDNSGIGKQSRGEAKIENILNQLEIIFIKEYIFDDCINPQTQSKLRFDFYLPDHNCCIEYDGEQHYQWHNSRKGWNTEDNFKQTQYRDSIKNDYCQRNKIKLIRIPYYEYDKIDKVYLLHLIQDLDV